MIISINNKYLAKISQIARASVVAMAETNEVAEQLCVRAFPKPHLVENLGRQHPGAGPACGYPRQESKITTALDFREGQASSRPRDSQGRVEQTPNHEPLLARYIS